MKSSIGPKDEFSWDIKIPKGTKGVLRDLKVISGILSGPGCLQWVMREFYGYSKVFLRSLMGFQRPYVIIKGLMGLKGPN